MNLKALAVVLIWLGAASPALAQLASLQHDLRVAVAFAPFDAALNRLAQSRFRTEYNNNGTICSNPRAELRYSDFALKRHSILHGVGGDSALSIGLKVDPILKIERCDNFELPAECNASIVAWDIKQDLKLRGRCRFRILVSFFTFPIEAPIENPIELKERYVVELADPNPGEDVHLEFGELQGDRWVPAADPKRRSVKLSSRVTGAGGRWLENYQGRPIVFEENPSLLIGDFFVGEPDYLPVATLRDLRVDNEKDIPLRSGDLFGISLSPSFFGVGGEIPNGAGLFGALLPIRVYGVKTAGSRAFRFDAVLSVAHVRFVEVQGVPKVLIDLAVSRASLEDATIIGKAVPIKKIASRIALSAPRISSDGQLKLDVEEFRLSIEGDGGSIACACLGVIDLQKALDGGLPSLGQVKSEIKIELPECVDLGDDRFVAKDRNWNNYKCRAFNNRTQRLAANIDQQKATVIKLDLSQIDVRMAGERLHISLRPVDIVDAQALNEEVAPH